MDFRQAGERIRRGEIFSFYLFSGPDEYLKEELLQGILLSLEKKGKHFSVEKIDAVNLEGGLSGLAEDLRQTTIQASLLSEGRVLWLYNSLFFSVPEKGKSAKKGKGKVTGEEGAVAKLLEQDSPEDILIFSVPQVDKRRKIVKMAENAGRLIDFPLLKGAALLQWLESRLAKDGMQFKGDAALELVERTGENLTLLNNEIQKIGIYLRGEKTVSTALIRSLVPGSSQGNIFQLTDAIGRKEMGEATRHLAGIKAQGEHPLIILAMIARQFRLLFQLSLLQDKNLTRREMLANLKIPPFLLSKLQDQAKNYNLSSLARTITALKETDAAIKNGRLEAGDALEQMVLRLTI